MLTLQDLLSNFDIKTEVIATFKGYDTGFALETTRDFAERFYNDIKSGHRADMEITYMRVEDNLLIVEGYRLDTYN